MSETKFTPGPWEATEHGYIAAGPLTTNDRYGFSGYRKLLVHSEFDDEPELSEEEDKANAHLIAAAPELYQLLADISEFAHRAINPASRAPRIDKIDAALARARGEQS